YSGMSGNIKTYAFNMIRNYAWPSLGYNYTVYTTNTIYATNHYDHIINQPGPYYVTSISGDIIVTAPDVKLVIANGIDLSSGGNSITIANGATTGAAFQMYVGGSSFNVSSDKVHNLGLYSGSFIVYCDPS